MDVHKNYSKFLFFYFFSNLKGNILCNNSIISFYKKHLGKLLFNLCDYTPSVVKMAKEIYSSLFPKKPLLLLMCFTAQLTKLWKWRHNGRYSQSLYKQIQIHSTLQKVLLSFQHLILDNNTCTLSSQ